MAKTTWKSAMMKSDVHEMLTELSDATKVSMAQVLENMVRREWERRFLAEPVSNPFIHRPPRELRLTKAVSKGAKAMLAAAIAGIILAFIL